MNTYLISGLIVGAMIVAAALLWAFIRNSPEANDGDWGERMVNHHTSKQLETISGDLMLAGFLSGGIGIIAISFGPVLLGWWAAVIGLIPLAACALFIACAFRTADRARIVSYNEDKKAGII